MYLVCKILSCLFLYYSCFTSESHGSWSSYVVIEINLSLILNQNICWIFIQLYELFNFFSFFPDWAVISIWVAFFMLVCQNLTQPSSLTRAWVSSLAYPNLLGKKGYVVVVVVPWLSCKVSNCLSMSISSTFTQYLPCLNYEVLNGLFRNLSGILRCSTLLAWCLINIPFEEHHLVIRLLFFCKTRHCCNNVLLLSIYNFLYESDILPVFNC